MTQFNSLKDIDALLEANEVYRKKSLNLIASENIASPVVRKYHDTELIDRYGCYTTGDMEDREYTGNKYIHELEAATHELVKELFHAEYVDLRPLGGHMAGLATMLAVTPPGGLILEYHLKDWGHGMMGPTCENIPHFDKTLSIDYFEFDNNLQLKLDDLERKLDENDVSCVVLGSSGLLFPEPVREAKELCKRKNIPLIADASHVSGLIAGGVYPNPLDEGADIMFLSTHKSFPGPQGGMVLSNNKEYIERVGNILAPGMVTSHHVYRLPALAAALLEMKAVGKDYSQMVVRNAQALAAALDKRGIPCIAKEKGFTQSHLLLADISQFGASRDIAMRLEKANIFVSDDFGAAGSQIRLGTPEATRRGMKPEDMDMAAACIAKLLVDNDTPENVACDVEKLAARFSGCAYTL